MADKAVTWKHSSHIIPWMSKQDRRVSCYLIHQETFIMVNKETLRHTWSTQGPSTSMDKHNCSPQLFFPSGRVVHTHMDPIKQDIFSLDLLVCDGHQTLKIDYGGVDNVDSMAQTQWVSNISLQNNKVRKQWTELTVPLIMVLKCSLHDIFGALKKREKFMKTENREHFILPLGIT